MTAHSEKRPLISIIMATYNCANLVKAAIDSIINQSFENWELIIQDNLSVDEIENYIKGYSDERIKFNSEPDDGIYSAWNKALRRCNGGWVMFLGADDRLSGPTVLEGLLIAGEKTGGNVDLVSGRVQFYNNKGELGAKYGEPWLWRRLKNYHTIAHPGAIFKKDLWCKFGYFSEAYKIAGDYEFSLRIGNEVSPAYIPQVLVHMGSEGKSSKNKAMSLFEASLIQIRSNKISNFRCIGNLCTGILLLLYRKIFNAG